jgi:hypothetical protein
LAPLMRAPHVHGVGPEGSDVGMGNFGVILSFVFGMCSAGLARNPRQAKIAGVLWKRPNLIVYLRSVKCQEAGNGLAELSYSPAPPGTAHVPGHATRRGSSHFPPSFPPSSPRWPHRTPAMKPLARSRSTRPSRTWLPMASQRDQVGLLFFFNTAVARNPCC